jgi:hypothetical protein
MLSWNDVIRIKKSSRGIFVSRKIFSVIIYSFDFYLQTCWKTYSKNKSKIFMVIFINLDFKIVNFFSFFIFIDFDYKELCLHLKFGKIFKKEIESRLFPKRWRLQKNKSQFGDIKEVGEIKNPYFCNNFE